MELFKLLITCIGFISYVYSLTELNVSSGENEQDELLWDRCGHDLRTPTGLDKYIDVPFIKKVIRNLIQPYECKIFTHFYLYTRKSPHCGIELNVRDDGDHSLERYFGPNSTIPTRILIHGWMSQSKGPFNRLIKNAYLEKGDFNVIIVDWSIQSANINYNHVVRLVESISESIANFTKVLTQTTHITYDDIYLIGHSLGAQISGNTAKYMSPNKVNTIFALDPAGPKFKSKSNEFRIDSTDAKYVESIHTNGFHLGLWKPTGNATFYPNYGSYQKCLYFGCSHIRSYKYFAESITSDVGFWATECDEENLLKKMCSHSENQYQMGGEPSIAKSGVYFLETNSRSPFAKGKTAM